VDAAVGLVGYVLVALLVGRMLERTKNHTQWPWYRIVRTKIFSFDFGFDVKEFWQFGGQLSPAENWFSCSYVFVDRST
jgi:hypothetical protein